MQFNSTDQNHFEQWNAQRKLSTHMQCCDSTAGALIVGIRAFQSLMADSPFQGLAGQAHPSLIVSYALP